MNEYEEKHLNLLRPYLAECTVLLKKNGAFPLSAPCRIAAYGNGVRETVKGGMGSGEVNSRFFVNVEEGLEKAGFTVTSKEWLNAYEHTISPMKTEAFLREVRSEARKAHTLAILVGMGRTVREINYDLPLNAEGDAAIYVLSRMCGEGGDQDFVPGDLCLTETEIRDILALNEKFEKFMLVLNTGGPIDLSPVLSVGNILQLSQLGVETGTALAEILLGKQNPSGHLTTTWSDEKSQAGVGPFAEDKDDVVYEEGIFVGYRYFDAYRVKTVFPFGYGLSYTEFDVKEGETKLEKSLISVTAEVKNTGAFSGKETVQVYVSCPQTGLVKAVKELAGWKKTSLLAPGESETVTISFDLTDFASFDEADSAYKLFAGEYVVSMGVHAENVKPVAVITLPETKSVKKVRRAYPDVSVKERKPENLPVLTPPENVPRFVLNPEDIETVEVTYEREEEVLPEVKALSTEDLIFMSVGGYGKGGGLGGFIGNSASSVPGAAGEANYRYDAFSSKTLVMSDGPQGVRISRDYTEDEKGKHSQGGTLPETYEFLLPKVAQWGMKLITPKPKKGMEVKHQYATAIPIGTAVAQSFNPELQEMVGSIVGAEMAHFNARIWLAPALNIHRNIRCGRNFEYYSEDPRVSGLTASYVTKGVQSHEGIYVTIKHYCCNNREWNRNNQNSILSERTLREIYLKGFALCVRESSPRALMTSYNLVNGTHTSESRVLTEDILRDEFGFEGIVMTDWVTQQGLFSKGAKYLPPNAGKVACAGSGFFMPGSKGDMKQIKAALKDGSLTRKQLEINVSRVVRLTREEYGKDK